MAANTSTKPEDKTIWWLGWGAKYKDRPDQSCFGPRDLVSRHQFGWDTKEQGFVLKDDLGIAGTVHQRLPMPVELAEAFLLRCLDPTFREVFLTGTLPSEEAEETIEAGGAKLRVSRDKARIWNNYCLMPILSVSVQLGEGLPQRIFLFHEVRASFGRQLAQLSADEVRANLRAA